MGKSICHFLESHLIREEKHVREHAASDFHVPGRPEGREDSDTRTCVDVKAFRLLETQNGLFGDAEALPHRIRQFLVVL